MDIECKSTVPCEQCQLFKGVVSQDEYFFEGL
jgi:hypothetical protein